MVWFWTRDQEELQFETMYDNDSAEFLVRLTYSNGERRTERFASIAPIQGTPAAAGTGPSAGTLEERRAAAVRVRGFPNRRLT